VPSAPNSNARPWASCQHLRAGNHMKFLRRRFLRLIGAAVAGLFVSPLAWAQDYPTRAVTIIVPFTPGGSTDIIARMLAQKLEQRFGKSFVVENRPGAGTIIAASAVAKAAPDGYLLFMAPSSTMASCPGLSFAYAISSSREWTGSDGLTINTNGTRASPASGMKSVAGS
jgi:hypothetical protein